MDKTLLLKKFGKNVKIQRIKRDYTQEKLAQIMDVSQNYIAGIERGKANMSLVKIYELASYLNVDIKVLVDFSED